MEADERGGEGQITEGHSNFIGLHAAVRLSQHRMLKRLSFLPWCVLACFAEKTFSPWCVLASFAGKTLFSPWCVLASFAED